MNRKAVEIENEAALQQFAPAGVRVNASANLIAKLASNDDKASDEEISVIAEYLLAVNGRRRSEEFALATSLDALKPALARVQADFFAIFKATPSSHWTVMAISRSSYSTIVYLMNPFGDLPIASIQTILDEAFGLTTVRLNGGRSNDPNLDDFLALAHLETMLTRNLSGIDSFGVASRADVARLKARLKESFLKNVYASAMSDASGNAEFRARLRDFLDQCGEFSELSVLALKYRDTLAREAKNLEIEGAAGEEARRRIEAARNEFTRSEKVATLESVEVEGDGARLKIERDFPKEMATFRSFMDVLKNADDKINNELREYSAKIGYDLEKLKRFFALQKLSVSSESQPVTPRRSIPTAIIKTVAPEPSATEDEAGVKSVEELLAEMSMEDSDESNDAAVIAGLRADFAQFRRHTMTWQSRSVAEIRSWSDSMRGRLKRSQVPEAMAVLNRANTLVKGWRSLRDAQVLPVLAYFYRKDNHGAFYEILTGEGKTVIVALMAVLKVLMGEKFVDVVTSNSVLAQDGVDDRREFYAVFDISVDTNNYRNDYKRGAKACYAADVVYGTMGNFQGDYLRHEFERLETRGDRDFGCLILDEVDSILLDNGGHITKLATPFPGMDCLKYVYIRIWQALLKVEREMPAKFQASLEARTLELQSDAAKDEELQKFSEEFLANSRSFIVNAIRATNPADIPLIPPHLRQFAKDALEKWIASAIYARFQCHEDVHYVIRKNEAGEASIVPVDYQNTGVALQNTVWSEGLHQFVQLKHNLSMSTETLTSSFVSNIGYVRLYRNNLIGMTGTLGSMPEYELLSKVYNLNYIEIPPFKTKNFFKDEGMVVADEAWVDAVAVEAIMQAKSRRSVLVICRTILEVFKLRDAIEFMRQLEDFTELKVKLYADDGDSDVVKAKVGPCEIIIATNIAGRGSNFRTTPELEANGGLHVCVSFLPTNMRVQSQAFGRTSRQGKKGTAQIIAKASDIRDLGGDINNFTHLEYDSVEEFRDEKEKERLAAISSSELPKIIFMDAIFQKFLSFYRELRDQEGYTKPYLKDLKEHWAFWLKAKDYKHIDGLSVDAEFEQFKGEVSRLLTSKVYRNPFYYIEDAELSILAENLDEAKEVLQKAIASMPSNPELLYTANIKLFEVAIEQGHAMRDRVLKLLRKLAIYGYFEDDHEHSQYLSEAREYLTRARTGLQVEIDYIKENFFGDAFNEILTRGLPSNRLNSRGDGRVKRSTAAAADDDVDDDDDDDDVLDFFEEENDPSQLECGLDQVDLNSSQVGSYAGQEFIESSQVDNKSSQVDIESSQVDNNSSQVDIMASQVDTKSSQVDSNLSQVESLLRSKRDASISQSEESLPPLAKHIRSRITILSTFDGQLESLGEQLTTMNNAIVRTRIPNYFANFQPDSPNDRELKNAMLPTELNDLAAIGLDTVYSLQEVKDVHNAVIVGAQVQIGAGLTALAAGFAFPPALPLAGPVAGALISEGFCDIIVELLRSMGDTFDWVRYLKDKAISYGIAIATFGLSAATSSLKLLAKVMQAIKKVAKALKSCPVFTRVAQKAAAALERVAALLQSQIAKARQLTKATTFGAAARTVAAETFRDAIFTLVSEKLVTENLRGALDGLKPQLKEKCAATARAAISESDVARVSANRLGELVDELLVSQSIGGHIGEVAREIGLGVLRVQRNWALKVASLTIDALVTTVDLTAGLDGFCRDLRARLNNEATTEDGSSSVAAKFEAIAAQMSEYMCAQIVKVLGRGVNTFAVSPIIAKVSDAFSTRDKVESKELVAGGDANSSRLSEAYNLMSLRPGASEAEVGRRFRELSLESHPQRPGGDQERFQALVNARDDIVQSMRGSSTVLFSTAPGRGSDFSATPAQPTTYHAPPSPPPMPRTERNQAHAGNIATISRALKISTRINEIDPQTGGVVAVHRFGRNNGGGSGGDDVITLNYTPATRDRLGHYTVAVGAPAPSSGDFNCLYDALSASLQRRNISLTPEQLRTLGESSSVANFRFNLANNASRLLDNAVTRNLYVRAQNAILVGGAVNSWYLRVENDRGQYPGGIIYDKNVIGPPMMRVFNKIVDYSQALRPLVNASNKRQRFAASERKLAQRGAMVGVMSAELFDTTTQKTTYFNRWTLSGDKAYTIRREILNEDLGQISGFRFVNDIDFERDDRRVYDLHRHPTDGVYTQSCAAVKLSMALSDHLRRFPQLEVRARYMAECYFSAGGHQGPSPKITRENINQRVVASCEKCEKALPFTVPHEH